MPRSACTQPLLCGSGDYEDCSIPRELPVSTRTKQKWDNLAYAQSDLTMADSRYDDEDSGVERESFADRSLISDDSESQQSSRQSSKFSIPQVFPAITRNKQTRDYFSKLAHARQLHEQPSRASTVRPKLESRGWNDGMEFSANQGSGNGSSYYDNSLLQSQTSDSFELDGSDSSMQSFGLVLMPSARKLQKPNASTKKASKVKIEVPFQSKKRAVEPFMEKPQESMVSGSSKVKKRPQLPKEKRTVEPFIETPQESMVSESSSKVKKPISGKKEKRAVKSFIEGPQESMVSESSSKVKKPVSVKKEKRAVKSFIEGPQESMVSKSSSKVKKP